MIFRRVGGLGGAPTLQYGEPVPRTTPSSSPSRPKGRRRLYRALAAFVVLAGVGGYLAVQYLSGSKDLLTGCEVRVTGGAEDGEERTYEMGTDQAANAATIAAVGAAHGMPEQAVAIALATALQESQLHNIDYGDRDSLGLFQQRPSQGWGTSAEIMDPAYASGKFYDHLAKIPDYTRLPLTEAAQRVQRSGFPQAYAKHEPDALLLAAALTGRTPASLNCAPPVTATAAPGDPDGLRTELVRDFGTGVLPVAEAAGPAATHTVVVPARARAKADSSEEGSGAAADARRGWTLAHWAVARASTLGIDRIDYAGRVWTPGPGWRTDQDQADGAESDTGEVRMRLAQ